MRNLPVILVIVLAGLLALMGSVFIVNESQTALVLNLGKVLAEGTPDVVSRDPKVIAEIERPVAFGLSVSPDQKTFIYARPVTGADLMLIENFR